jgi:hypothetical protein
MRGIILAWMIGEGIIVFRSVRQDHSPPVPGALLATSGLFILLAILAEYQPARGLATTFAFGVDIAALLNLGGLGGGTKAAPAPSKTTPKEKTV